MNSKLVCVYSGTEITINLLKEILEESGIPAFIQNDFNSGVTAGFGGGTTSTIDLFIDETDLQKAGPIITDFSTRQK
ncbi:MAG: DUF2007 domain-containing protein [Mangrovibacterium sp.]